MNKYSSLDLSGLELENSDAAQVVQGMIQGNNRAQRRNILKALAKVENRDLVYNKRLSQETKQLHQNYNKQLQEKMAEGLVDDWKKSTALAALTLKRKYNWNKGRVQSFVGKMNELHVEMVKSGEYAEIEKLLDEECDIQLEVVD
jgi:hypothetical protein